MDRLNCLYRDVQDYQDTQDFKTFILSILTIPIQTKSETCTIK